MDIDIEKYLSDKAKIIDASLKGYLAGAGTAPKLDEAVRYSVFSGGKRFRPVLSLAASEAFGGRAEAVLQFACSIEFIHTYSLVHDDLPAMDDDDLRRGKPTNHKVFGEATAILAGDALLTMAFEIASRPLALIDPIVQMSIISEIAQASGKDGMVGGQQLDLEAEGKKLALDGLRKIHLHKTGKLIQCAVTVGAISAGATQPEVSHIRSYGENLGLAFQITDDHLDFTGKIPGKNPGGDLKNDKSTFATVLGPEKCAQLAFRAVDDAVKAVLRLGTRGEILRNLALYVGKRIR